MKSLSLYGVVLLLFSVILSVWGAVPSVTCTPTRTSGVAPLAVFLDCSATTDADLVAYATQPFHDLLYQHNFGDTAPGKWGDKSTGSAGTRAESRNAGWGPLVAHVYETPGTYTITTLVRKSGVTVRSTVNVITVTDPNTVFATTATVCFYNTTVGTGCPADATQTASSDFDAALTSCIGATKRCLFKRGDTFTASTHSVVNASIVTIGAYGTGAKPIIKGIATFSPQKSMAEADGSKNVFILLSSNATPTISDVRIMDLELDGESDQDTMAIAADGSMSKILMLNVNCHHMGTTCFSLNDGIIQAYNGAGVADPHHIWDQVFIVDSNLNSITALGHINLYASAQHLVIMGNDIEVGTNELVRTPYMIKGIISHNFMGYTDKNHLLKLHGPTYGSSWIIEGDVPSKYIVISDNKFIGDDGSPLNAIAWPVAIGTQDTVSDQRVEDVIYERNYSVGSSTTQIASIFWVVNLTYRNNVCDLTISQNVACLSITRRGIEPVPDNHFVYNNTLYSAKVEAVNQMRFLTLGAAATNTIVKNNLGYTPNAGALNSYMVDGAGGGGLVQATNSTDRSAGAGHQMKNTSPAFDNVSALQGFRVGTGNYAATGGTALFPSSNDDALHCDDNTANEHIGAFVPRARAQCRGMGQ